MRKCCEKKRKFYLYFNVIENTICILLFWNANFKFTHVLKFNSCSEAILYFNIWSSSVKYSNNVKNAVFFDSGLGGEKTTIQLFDSNKQQKIDLSLFKKDIEIFVTKFVFDSKQLIIKEKVSNNFCELFACFLACKAAIYLKYNLLLGDSSIVIFFWLLFAEQKLLKIDLMYRKMILFIRKMKKIFNIKICYINRILNKADLGNK